MPIIFTQTLSLLGTTVDETLRPDFLPRGSALITHSGDLEQTGIEAIIHAATGAMNKKGGVFEPNLEAVSLSIANAFELMRANKLRRLAVPFLAGKIFKKRMGATAEQIARVIIESCLQHAESVSFIIVAFDAADFKVFETIFRNDFPSEDVEALLIEADITMFASHHADVILNAANMEVKFGGGLSKRIALASKDKLGIDLEAAQVIADFWSSTSV